MSGITPEAVPNQYIVSFKRGTPSELFQEHVQWAQATHTAAAAQRAESDGPELTGVGKTFTFPDLYAYVGSFDESVKAEIEARDEVAHVEPDYIVKANSKQTQNNVPSWGLARVSSTHTLPAAPANVNYTYDSTAGQGVTAYVIDSGIMINHTDFGGRARWGENLIGGPDTDENGHGTHVAGTIGGTTYGVAKKATLVAVKVLDSKGNGTSASVLGGLQWVINDATGKANKSVVNMSLGGSKSSVLNSAVASVVAAGIFCAVAAGNDSDDASKYSPASEPQAFTVGSIDRDDSASWFSNFGQPLAIYAPGGDITSAWISPGTSGSNTISGTSMATPHIAGLAACLIAENPGANSTPNAIRNALINLAGGNSKVTPVVPGTTSLISYNGS